MKKFLVILLVMFTVITGVFATSTSFKMNDTVALEDFTFTADVGYGGVGSAHVGALTLGARWAMASASIDFDGYSLPSTIDVVATVTGATEFNNFVLPGVVIGVGFTSEIAQNIFTTFDVGFVVDGAIVKNSDFSLALGFDVNVVFGYHINDTIGAYVKGSFTDLYTSTASNACWSTSAGVALNF